MKTIFTKPFVKQYQNLPLQIQEQFDKQLGLFLKDSRHPSLGVKKVQSINGKIFEARVSKGYRFTFQIQDEYFIFRKIGTHDILRMP